MKSKYEGKFKAGDKYKMLTIVDGNIIMDREACIKVKCDCGKDRIVPVIYLIRGKVVSCGCQMNKSGNSHPLWAGSKYVSSTMFKKLKRGANQRNIEFLINCDYLDNLLENQNFKCKLTNLPIDLKSMSVDRIDSSIGYTENNIRWIHKDVNIMKNSFSENYFKYLCGLICGINSKIPVQRERFKRNEYDITLIDSDKNIHQFNNMIDIKSFVDEFNKKNKLNGPSRIGWNEISRFRESKGWKIIKKVKL
jgi:hypothetical protein